MAPLTASQASLVAAAGLAGLVAGAGLAGLLHLRRQRREREEDGSPSIGATERKGVFGSGEAPVDYDRIVHCEDALPWLAKPGSIPSNAMVFTSLPDVSEVQETCPTLQAWEAWFMQAAQATLKAAPLDGVVVFYQTDIRVNGRGQVSKAHLVLKAASELDDVGLLWHKIVHFESFGRPSFGSPQFSHLLCFRKKGRTGEVALDVGGGIPDVLARGAKPWNLRKSACCMGVNSVLVVLKWVLRNLPGVDVVVDPFCGAGTVLAIANSLGLSAIGVDLSSRRVKQAKKLDGDALLAGKSSVETS